MIHLTYYLAEDYVEEIYVLTTSERGLIPRIISHLKDNKDVIWYPSGTNYNMIEPYNETNQIMIFNLPNFTNYMIQLPIIIRLVLI